MKSETVKVRLLPSTKNCFVCFNEKKFFKNDEIDFLFHFFPSQDI